MHPIDFPVWLRAAHFFNLLFLTLSARSGIEILSAHPKLYFNDHCTPGTEWLRLTRKQMPEDQLWTSTDEAESFSPWIALPGRRNLGLGRHWHFLGDLGWLLTGVFYVVLLFADGEWRRLVPTTWRIFPEAWHVFLTYASLHLVETPGRYNALQQLAYFALVFGVAPLTIATGLAMSPTISARFPGYIRIFRGRQSARSIHFICLCAFTAFFVVHVSLVVAHGFAKELCLIVLGDTTRQETGAALALGLFGIFLVIAVHVVGTVYSHRHPRLAEKRTRAIVDLVRRPMLPIAPSHPSYTASDLSPCFRVNGRPPRDAGYEALASRAFATWALEVGGLVDRPLRLTLADLRAMPRESQRTLHCCIQGWSAIAEWSGVPLRYVLEAAGVRRDGRFVVFHAFDDKSTSEPHPEGKGLYYETVELELALKPLTILADQMNGHPLPIEHGAPLRVRIETQLGFTMVKYIRAIEVVRDYRHLGLGQGGWREDWMYYDPEAPI